jgi:hypothetical protein
MKPPIGIFTMRRKHLAETAHLAHLSALDEAALSEKGRDECNANQPQCDQSTAAKSHNHCSF